MTYAADFAALEQEAMIRARAAAEKGLAWIREVGEFIGLRPIEILDLMSLRLRSCTSCVLGQLGGNYSDVVSRIFPGVDLNKGLPPEVVDWAAEHGFDRHFGDIVTHEHLDEAWRQLITEERNAA